MLVDRETKDDIIECLYKSSNVIASRYAKGIGILEVTFSGGIQYRYFDVPDREYMRFEIAESQGKIINTVFKKYKGEKFGKVDQKPLLEQIETILRERKG